MVSGNINGFNLLEVLLVFFFVIEFSLLDQSPESKIDKELILNDT